MYVDVHCHIEREAFDADRESVIEKARKAGVTKIIVSGTDQNSNRQVMELTAKHPDILRCSLGIYPSHAVGIEEPTINVDDELKFITENKDKIAGLGECGLDFTYERKEEQKKVFAKVIETCEKTGLPIIVHTRKAEQECIEMLEKSKLKKVILHCFMGRKNLVKKAAALGYSFSVPPIIIRNQQFQQLVEIVGISQLLTETDAPWLSGTPGARNEPVEVIRTVEEIARIKGFAVEETKQTIFLNYQRMFE